MRTSLEVELAALILSGIAIAVSIVSFARQHDLQKRTAAIEEARRKEEVASRLVADVTAGVRREPGKGHGWSVVLTNRGPAVAENVDVEITAEGLRPPELGKEDHSFPITLDAGQDYSISLMVLYGARPTFQTRLSWEDGRGPQTKTLSLSL